MIDLSGRSALVTGAGSGIGRAIAVRLAEAGADVAINYHSGGAEETGSEVDAACDAIRGVGCRELLVQADVSDESQVEAMLRQVLAAWGRIDILVNNAGIQIESPSHQLEVEDFDRVLAVNLRGAFLCAKAVIGHLVERDAPGAIVNVSSVHEEIPKPGFVGYSAAKGGLRALTGTLALEYAHRGIRVNAVAPGAVATPMNPWVEDPQRRAAVEARIPLRRITQPREVADLVAYLASDLAVSITGQSLFIDGGLSCYPAFAENWTS